MIHALNSQVGAKCTSPGYFCIMIKSFSPRRIHSLIYKRQTRTTAWPLWFLAWLHLKSVWFARLSTSVILSRRLLLGMTGVLGLLGISPYSDQTELEHLLFWECHTCPVLPSLSPLSHLIDCLGKDSTFLNSRLAFSQFPYLQWHMVLMFWICFPSLKEVMNTRCFNSSIPSAFSTS